MEREGMRNAGDARDARLARLTVGKLRGMGFECVLNDVRTPTGKRLDPVSFRVGHLSVMVRPVGHRLTALEAQAMRLGLGTCFLQLGTTDLTRLVAWLRSYQQRVNPFPKP